jgi:hypothetical protein
LRRHGKEWLFHEPETLLHLAEAGIRATLDFVSQAAAGSALAFT